LKRGDAGLGAALGGSRAVKDSSSSRKAIASPPDQLAPAAPGSSRAPGPVGQIGQSSTVPTEILSRQSNNFTAPWDATQDPAVSSRAPSRGVVGPTSGLAPGPSPGTTAAPGLSALGPSPLGASLLSDVDSKPGSQLGWLSFQSSGTTPQAASEQEEDDRESIDDEAEPSIMTPPPPTTAPPPMPKGGKSSAVAKPPGLETPELAPTDEQTKDPPALELAAKESSQQDEESDSEDAPQQFQPGSAASWLNSGSSKEPTGEKEDKAQETSVFRADAPAFYPKAMHDTFALRAALGLPGSTPPSELVPDKPPCFLEPEVQDKPTCFLEPEESLPMPPREAPPPAPVSAREESLQDSGRSEEGSSDEAPQFFPHGVLEDDDIDESHLLAPGLGPPPEPPPPAPLGGLDSTVIPFNGADAGSSAERVDERLRQRCLRFGLAHELPCINLDSSHRYPPEVMRETILQQRLVIEDLLQRLEATMEPASFFQ